QSAYLIQTRPSSVDTSMSESGVNGCKPQHTTRSSSAMSSSSVRSKRWQTSAIAGPSWATTHGTSARSRRRRSSAETRGTLQPVHQLGAELVGRQDLGVVEEAEHEGTESVPVRDEELDDDAAVGAVLDHAGVAEMVQRPAGLVTVDTEACRHCRLVADLPRLR